MNLTRGTLLCSLPDARFAVTRIDGEWRARAMHPGAEPVEVRSASLLDVIRRVVRSEPPRPQHYVAVGDDGLRPQHYVAVGDDGLRPVVWGVGTSPEAARRDAQRWLGGHGDLDALAVYPATAEQARRVLDGDPAWASPIPPRTE
jgi:hypothetical protein